MAEPTKDDRTLEKALRRRLKQIDNSFVEIGILKDAKHPGNIKRNTEGPSKPSTTTVPQIAFWLEFGTSNMVARPFMRSTIDANLPFLTTKNAQILQQVQDGRISPKKGLDKLGFIIKELMKNRIQESTTWAKPLKGSTIKTKQRGALRSPSHPLIDSGTLLKSIAFKTVLRTR